VGVGADAAEGAEGLVEDLVAVGDEEDAAVPDVVEGAQLRGGIEGRSPERPVVHTQCAKSRSAVRAPLESLRPGSRILLRRVADDAPCMCTADLRVGDHHAHKKETTGAGYGADG